MNAILSPILLAAMMVAEPAWAGCVSQKYLSLPKIIDLPYPKARISLIKAGFQPLLDWGRMQRDYELAEAWIDHTNYFEVQGCSSTGLGLCRANFVDYYRNLLRIVIEDPSGAGPKVTDVFFVCGADAANVFQP